MQEEQNETHRDGREKNSGKPPTVADAVQKLIALAEEAEEAEGKAETCC